MDAVDMIADGMDKKPKDVMVRISLPIFACVVVVFDPQNVTSRHAEEKKQIPVPCTVVFVNQTRPPADEQRQS